MKRFRIGEAAGEMDSVKLANVLMLLSRGAGDEAADGFTAMQSSSGRVFECKTCSRKFPSFQALGGHRASHKKPRVMGDQSSPAHSAAVKPRVHECSICGLEFAIGQALGGHMRRHRAATEGLGHGHGQVEEEKKGGGDEKSGRRVLCLDFDLNLPPMENDKEFRGLGLGIGLPMVDCFH